MLKIRCRKRNTICWCLSYNCLLSDRAFPAVWDRDPMDVDFPLQALVAVDLQSWPTLNSCDTPGIMVSPPLSQQHVDSMAWVPQEPPTAESIKSFIEDQAVSPSYDLVPLPSPVSKLTILSQSSCVSLAELWQGKGVGIRRRDVLVFYKSFNIFWPRVYSKYVRRHVQLCTYCTLYRGPRNIKFQKWQDSVKYGHLTRYTWASYSMYQLCNGYVHRAYAYSCSKQTHLTSRLTLCPVG